MLTLITLLITVIDICNKISRIKHLLEDIRGCIKI